MLSDRRVYATIPASNLARARDWYESKLGLKPSSVENAGAMYELGAGTSFLLYPTTHAGQAPNTLMTFTTSDIRADVSAMRAKGVVFENYDFPGLKTDDGVADLGNRQAAWFRDSEGNILALGSD